MLGRILVAVLCAAVCGWFVLGIVQAQDTDAATKVIGAGAHLSRAEADHAAALLSSAATLNPDRSVALLRSRLALRTGDPHRALALAQAVTRAEPLNVNAWAAVATAALALGDKRMLAGSVRRIGVLDPAARAQ